MLEIKIIDQNFQEHQISLENIQEWLNNAQIKSLEKPKTFNLDQITKQISNYLEIFLLNPQNSLTLKQLKDLIAQNLNQNNFPLTAICLEQTIQLGLTNTTQTQLDQKLANLYQINNLLGEVDLSEAIKKTTLPINLQNKLINLIEKKLFFPSHNFFNSKYYYDQENITVKDNLESIFESLHQFTNNFLKRISSNINFSDLRAKLSIIKSSQNRSAGPITFIKIFTETISTIIENNPTEHPVKQTITLSSDHPDLLEFLVFLKNLDITIYQNFLKFRLIITPAFLEAYFQKQEFDLINPHNQQIANTLNAENTMQLILEILQENQLLELTFQNDQEQNNQKSISGIIDLAQYIIPNEKVIDYKLLQKTILEGQKIFQSNQENLQIKINLCGWFQVLELLQINSNSAHGLETLNQMAENIKTLIPKNLQIEISNNTPILEIIGTTGGLDHFSINDNSPEFHLQIQRIFEQNLLGKIEKNIYLNPTNSENIIETIVPHLGHLKYLKIVKIKTTDKHLQPNDFYQNTEKNFLHNLNKIKKRSHQQIQPPLFSLKKTEEIFLPPINSLKND